VFARDVVGTFVDLFYESGETIGLELGCDRERVVLRERSTGG
jgi:hypothetical protein